MLDVECKRILLRKPARDRRRERADQLGPNVQKCYPGRAQEIFEGAGDIEIHVECFYVKGPRSAVLITVEHHQGTVLMCLLHNARDFRSETVGETDLREWNNKRAVVDRAAIRIRRNLAVFRGKELDLGAPGLLREPDLPHSRKLEFAQDNLVAFIKIECAGDGINPRRGAGHHGDFLRTRTNETRKCSASRFVFFYPAIPGRPFFVPGANVGFESSLNCVAECTLRARIEVYLVPEDGKPRTNGLNGEMCGQSVDLRRPSKASEHRGNPEPAENPGKLSCPR